MKSPSASQPVVSIITAAYNAEEYISETVESVLAQDFTNWEWIIADDGSADKTCTILSQYTDSRIRVIRCEHSGLPSVGRNRALQVAEGEFIAFLDADDIWNPKKLTEQLRLFKNQSGMGLCFTRYALWSGKGAPGRVVPDVSALPNPGDYFKHLCYRSPIGTSTVMVRGKLLETHGVFDIEPNLRGTEDYDLWLRLSEHTQFGYAEDPLVWYRVHPGSVSRNEVRIIQNSLFALKRALDRNKADARAPSWNTLEPYWNTLLGRAQLLDGVDDKGRRALLTSIRQNPFRLSAWSWLILSIFGTKIARQITEYRAFKRT